MRQISEEIHETLQELMNHPDIEPKDKMNFVSGMARQMIASGEDPGLEDSEPKLGSSRAVFMPKEPKTIILDRKQVQVPSVVKIAFPGRLDRYNKSGKLLGEHQNEVESDRMINNAFSVIHQHPATGEWHSNPNGVLPPHFGHHPQHHWLEMGRVEPITEENFREATKTEDFPEGLKHSLFKSAIEDHWHVAHGEPEPLSPRARHRMEHPLVKNVMKLVAETGVHPGDFNESNMGIWIHPLTGKKHVLISDFGYANDVVKHYSDARDEHKNVHGVTAHY